SECFPVLPSVCVPAGSDPPRVGCLSFPQPCAVLRSARRTSSLPDRLSLGPASDWAYKMVIHFSPVGCLPAMPIPGVLQNDGLALYLLFRQSPASLPDRGRNLCCRNGVGLVALL